MANRLRSVLPEEERASLEAALAALAPLLDLRTPHPCDSAAEGDEGRPEPSKELAAGHGMIEELASVGCVRADALAKATGDSAAQLLSAAPQGDAAGGSGDAAAAQHEGEEAAVGVAASGPAPAALKALSGLHADGVKSVAELCSLCLERLLALARSCSSQYRYGRPASDGITWPAEPAATGQLLRGQALRMLEELQSAGAAFGAALAAAATHLDAAAGSKAYSAATAPLAHGLQADAESAATRVHDACRALLQVVWLTAVPRSTVDDLL